MQEPLSFHGSMALSACMTGFLLLLLSMGICADHPAPRRALVIMTGPLFVVGMAVAVLGSQADNGGAMGVGGTCILGAVCIFSVELMRMFANKAGL